MYQQLIYFLNLPLCKFEDHANLVSLFVHPFYLFLLSSMNPRKYLTLSLKPGGNSNHSVRWYLVPYYTILCHQYSTQVWQNRYWICYLQQTMCSKNIWYLLHWSMNYFYFNKVSFLLYLFQKFNWRNLKYMFVRQMFFSFIFVFLSYVT